MGTQPRKQLLIETAYQLFNEFGYHATGIDTILQVSGVSKATLYKHFRSKEALILAVLQYRHEHLEENMHKALASSRYSDEKKVLAIFDALDDWFQSGIFFGCNFIRASGEYAHQDDPIYQYSLEHKRNVQELIGENLIIENKRKKQEVAAQLALLIDGAIVTAHTGNNKEAAKMAKKMAEKMIMMAGKN